MLINKLPKRFSPEKLCKQAPKEGSRFEGELLLGELSGLAEEFRAQKSVKVQVSLIFGLDEAGLCCINGEMRVEDLAFICQRCLKPMTLSLHSTIKVSPIEDAEQDKVLPKHYEPLLAANGDVTLSDWIAEELLLALPLVPRHELPCIGEPEVAEQSENGKTNDFRKALLKLKDMK